MTTINYLFYAILSHMWGPDSEEVSFKDLVDGTGKNKVGYEKIEFCRKRAASNDLQHFWVDTCCIDKASGAELSKAINSMVSLVSTRRQNATYIYLTSQHLLP